MTDSGIRGDDLVVGGEVRPDYAQLRYDGRLYRINTKTSEITKLDSGFRFTNGIVFGLDRSLYVNETLTGMIYRYAWNDGKIGTREGFGNVLDPSGFPGFIGPDGMKFGLDMCLYVTVYGQGDVTVLDVDGKVKKRIRTEGRFPTNCAFGPPGSKRLYVTEDELGTIEVFDVGVDGIALYG
jgi:gluconolactonase